MANKSDLVRSLAFQSVINRFVSSKARKALHRSHAMLILNQDIVCSKL